MKIFTKYFIDVNIGQIMQAILLASAILDKSKDTVHTILWIRDENGNEIANQIKFGYAQILFQDRDPESGWGDGDWGASTYTDDNSFSRTYFDKSYADSDGKLSVAFNHPFSITDLKLHVSLELDNTLTFDEVFPVLIESETVLNNIKLEEQPFQPNKFSDHKRPGPKKVSSSLPPPSMAEAIDLAKEEIVSDPAITIRSLILDFTLQSPQLKGKCIIDYSGGGNRLLELKDIGLSDNENASADELTNLQKQIQKDNFDQTVLGDASANPNVFIKHIEDEIPYKQDAKLFVESVTTNLLTNQQFILGVNTPTGYEFIYNNAVVTSKIINSVSDIANTWEVSISNTRFGNEEVFFQAQDSVIIDAARPLTFSTYFNILAKTTDSKVNKLKIIFYFRDQNDVLLGTKIEEIDPSSLIKNSKSSLRRTRFDEFTRISSSIHPSEYPLNTEKVFWQISLSEINRGDSFALSLFLPQLEQTKTPTTFVLDNSTRLADIVTVKQLNCLQLQTGEISLGFIANHAEPLSDTYFFDTRHPVTLLNGFAAWHEAGSNLIKFSIADTATNQVIQSTGPVIFLPGSRIDFRVKWVDGAREIWLSEIDQIVLDLNPYAVPTVNNDDIFLGSDAKKTPSSYINSELKEFRISKFLLSQFTPVP